MSYRFHHLRTRSRNAHATAEAYTSALGCEIAARTQDPDGTRLVVLDPGTDVLLELHRDAYSPASRRPLIEAVAFAGPDPKRNRLSAPDGLSIELVKNGAKGDASHRPDRPYLHHVSCLVADLETAEEYFSSSFGFRRVFDFSKTGVGGFRFLADSHWNEARHNFTLEVIGGPDFGPEQWWWDAHGPHFDHLCFMCKDVEAAFGRGLDAGMSPMSPPDHYPEYDLTIGWLYDPDGVHVELMSTLDPATLGRAFEAGEVPNRWIDDWAREIAWLPPPKKA